MNLTFVELEAAVGRLMYGSAVLGVVIPKYHFVIKVAQRRINLLNRFPSIANKEVDLPMKIRAKLGEWRNELVYIRPREPLPHPDFAPHKNKLYTDASGKDGRHIVFGYRRSIHCRGEVGTQLATLTT